MQSYASVKVANAPVHAARKAYYNTGMESIEQLVQSVYPEVSYTNADIFAGDDVISDWSMSIGTFLLFSDEIVIFKHSPSLKLSIQRINMNETFEMIFPHGITLGNLAKFLNDESMCPG
jgi:hypothetical protein